MAQSVYCSRQQVLVEAPQLSNCLSLPASLPAAVVSSAYAPVDEAKYECVQVDGGGMHQCSLRAGDGGVPPLHVRAGPGGHAAMKGTFREMDCATRLTSAASSGYSHPLACQGYVATTNDGACYCADGQLPKVLEHAAKHGVLPSACASSDPPASCYSVSKIDPASAAAAQAQARASWQVEPSTSTSGSGSTRRYGGW